MLVFLMHPAGVDWFLVLKEEFDKNYFDYYVVTASNIISSLLRQEMIEHILIKNINQIEIFFERTSPNVVVTDAAFTHYNQEITRLAKNKGIVVVSILDFFGNYDKRFEEIPDFIVIPNEYIRQEMIKLGFESIRLLPYGNPFFEKMLKYNTVYREEFDKYLSKDKKNILYISQCFKEDEYSITQEQIFREKVLREFDICKDNMMVKLHPREDGSWTSKYNVKVVSLTKNTYIYDLIGFCDVVIGVNSLIIYVCFIKGIYFKSINIDELVSIPFDNSLIRPYTDSTTKIIEFLDTII